jgi:hypothetical protein
VVNSAAIREPHRPLLFALALLIHIGLYLLLVSPRHTSPAAPERRTVLVFLQDAAKPRRLPRQVAPLAPPRLPEPSPPASTAPELIAPLPSEPPGAPPSIDWRGAGEQVARDHALEAEADRDPKQDKGTPQPKPEFGWSHSRIHRIEPMESGGFIVWISDNCFIVIGVMAMPMCKLGRKPARGDLFEHMDDPPAPGDWKDD